MKNKKVEELMERKAKEIHCIVLLFAEQHGKETPNPQWEKLRETAKEHYRLLARQFLNDDALALIDRGEIVEDLKDYPMKGIIPLALESGK